MLLPRPKERNSFTPSNDPTKHNWFFADVSQLVDYFSYNSEEEQDQYTPSAGVGRSVKEMLGFERSDRQVLPVYLEEIFGETDTVGSLLCLTRNTHLCIECFLLMIIQYRGHSSRCSKVS
jgi:hypothetical protein